MGRCVLSVLWQDTLFSQCLSPPRSINGHQLANCQGNLTKLVSYQREVDKSKLTAVASFEKLTFRNVSFSKLATAVNSYKLRRYGVSKRQLFKTRYCG